MISNQNFSPNDHKGLTPDSYQTKVLANWADVEAIATQWDELHRSTGAAIFCSIAWMRAQMQSFGASGQLCFITIWQGDALAGAATLVKQRIAISKRLARFRPETLTGFVCQYTGHLEFLARDAAAETALAQAVAITARSMVVDMKLLREGPMRDKIVAALEALGMAPTLKIQFQSAVTDASKPWEELLPSLSASFRKDNRKSERRFAAAGIKVSVFRTGPDALIERVFAVAKRSWKYKTNTSLASSTAATEFVRQIWRVLAPKHDLVLTIFSLKDVDFGICMMLRCNGRWIGIWSDFDEAYAEFTPGRSGICRSFDEVMNKGDIEIDVMRRTHFTGAFNGQIYEISRLRAFPRNSLARWIVWAEGKATSTVRRLRLGEGGKKIRRKDVV